MHTMSATPSSTASRAAAHEFGSYEQFIEHIERLENDVQKRIFIHQQRKFHRFLPRLKRTHPKLVDLFCDELLWSRKYTLAVLRDEQTRKMFVDAQKKNIASEKGKQEITMADLGPLEKLYYYYQYDLEVCSAISAFRLDQFIRQTSLYNKRQIASLRSGKAFSTELVRKLYGCHSESGLDETIRTCNLLIGIRRFTEAGQRTLTCKSQEDLFHLIRAASISVPGTKSIPGQVASSSQVTASSEQIDKPKAEEWPVILAGPLLQAIIDHKDFNSRQAPKIAALVQRVLNREKPTKEEKDVFSVVECALREPATNRAILESEAAKQFTPRQLARLAELDNTGKTAQTLTHITVWQRIASWLGKKYKSPSVILESADGDSIARVAIASDKAAAQVFARPEFAEKLSVKDLFRIACANKPFLNDHLKSNEAYLKAIGSEIQRLLRPETQREDMEFIRYFLSDDFRRASFEQQIDRMKVELNKLGLAGLGRVLVALNEVKKLVSYRKVIVDHILERAVKLVQYFRNGDISNHPLCKTTEGDLERDFIRLFIDLSANQENTERMLMNSSSRPFIRTFFRNSAFNNAKLECCLKLLEVVFKTFGNDKEKLKGCLLDFIPEANKFDVLHGISSSALICQSITINSFGVLYELYLKNLFASSNLLDEKDVPSSILLNLYNNAQPNIRARMLARFIEQDAKKTFQLFNLDANNLNELEPGFLTAAYIKLKDSNNSELFPASVLPRCLKSKNAKNLKLFFDYLFQSSNGDIWNVYCNVDRSTQDMMLREFIDRAGVRPFDIDAVKAFNLFELNTTEKLLRLEPSFLAAACVKLWNLDAEEARTKLTLFTPEVLIRCLDNMARKEDLIALLDNENFKGDILTRPQLLLQQPLLCAAKYTSSAPVPSATSPAYPMLIQQALEKLLADAPLNFQNFFEQNSANPIVQELSRYSQFSRALEESSSASEGYQVVNVTGTLIAAH